jgi:hypothetical protein
MRGRGRKQMLLLLAISRLYWQHIGPRARKALETLQREEEEGPRGGSFGRDDLESWLSPDVDAAPEDIRTGGLDYLRWLFLWSWKDLVNYQQSHPGWRPLIHDVFGNPFRPIAFDAAWRTDTVVSLAKHIYESRDFSTMPILADALQDAGCNHADVLDHCRDPKGAHVRGCWVVDAVLGKT